MSGVPGLPVVLDVDGALCVVAGAGVIGSRKARALVDAGADVRVIDPNGSDVPGATSIARTWRASDAEGALLVVAATNNSTVNGEVVSAARSAGALVLRADVGAAGDLRLPSSADTAGVRLSVDSGGASPALAAVVRRQLMEYLDTERTIWEQVAAWAADNHPVSIAATEAKLTELRRSA